MPRMKRKKNQPELSQENFKKHRSTLGMHLLEPVQVFHAPGKAAVKETRFSSSQALGNSRNPKDPQPPPASKPWLNTPHDAHHPEERRPEREAMKRRAQREREDAAKYTCAGKLQCFIVREKKMGTADYYGYVM
ncbi:hypothetical protein MUG91_G232n62 [Manis pentadactyla]|nr:hypothetical protein MUG91_G232n62 [Manis pentadactyla]